MQLHECNPYEWYFVVTCSDCKTKQALFHDASRGNARIRRTYEHQCDRCKSKAFYEPEEIVRYQHIVERRKKSRK